MISIRNRTWTTDRAGATCAWTDLEPGRSDEVAKLLAWAEGADVPAPDELADALGPDGIVAAVGDRFADEIGLWDTGPVG